MPIDKEFGKKWISALRSGKYPQGTHRLNRQGKYCCLGVACEVAGIKPELSTTEGTFSYNCSTASAPESLLKYGIDSCGTLQNVDKTLMELNDKGSTFEELADLIEAEVNAQAF